MKYVSSVALTLMFGSFGCGGATPPPAAPEAARQVLEAKPLEGPYASVEAWCKKVGTPACEPRTDIVNPVMNKPFRTRSGVDLEVATAASSDGKVQRGFTLIKRGADLFPLPPVIEYDPNDGKRHFASIFQFAQDSDVDPDIFVVAHLVTHPSTAPGAKSDAEDSVRINDICSAKPGKPIACVRVTTEAARYWPDGKREEMPGAQTLLIIKGLTLDAQVIQTGPTAPDITAKVIKDGSYVLKFP